jgi:tetratricopeptide (TPR) repeat protein
MAVITDTDGRARCVTVAAVALTLWFFAAALPARAQSNKLDDGPPPPEEAGAPAPDASPPAASPEDEPRPRLAPPEDGDRPTIAKRNAAALAPTEPAEPVMDPVGAARSVDVGTFYLKKGNYDAAIDRFQDAAQKQPKLAKPYLLMGEAYEKKNDSASALTAYRKYLELFPKAPDQDKVNKRIEKLEDETKRDTGTHPPG